MVELDIQYKAAQQAVINEEEAEQELLQDLHEWVWCQNSRYQLFWLVTYKSWNIIYWHKAYMDYLVEIRPKKSYPQQNVQELLGKAVQGEQIRNGSAMLCPTDKVARDSTAVQPKAVQRQRNVI